MDRRPNLQVFMIACVGCGEPLDVQPAYLYQLAEARYTCTKCWTHTEVTSGRNGELVIDQSEIGR